MKFATHDPLLPEIKILQWIETRIILKSYRKELNLNFHGKEISQREGSEIDEERGDSKRKWRSKKDGGRLFLICGPKLEF